MVMVMAATKHGTCERYFGPLYQALEIVMQRVYGESDIHRDTFVNNGYVTTWNEHLRDVAEERWIDAIFGISALLSVTTQLNHSHSQGKFCIKHGLPFLRLAQAATSNIAIYMVDDALLHLSSLRGGAKINALMQPIDTSSNSSEHLIETYWEVVGQACDVVEENSTSHQVEMVFAQFRFRDLITKQWQERKAA